jgi:hypothetical protein
MMKFNEVPVACSSALCGHNRQETEAIEYLIHGNVLSRCDLKPKFPKCDEV